MNHRFENYNEKLSFFLKSYVANIVKKGNFLTHFEGVTKAQLYQLVENYQ